MKRYFAKRYLAVKIHWRTNVHIKREATASLFMYKLISAWRQSVQVKKDLVIFRYRVCECPYKVFRLKLHAERDNNF